MSDSAVSTTTIASSASAVQWISAIHCSADAEISFLDAMFHTVRLVV